MKFFFIIWTLFFFTNSFSQDSLAHKKKWEFSGYVKELLSLNFERSFQNVYATNLVHNRINVRWNPSEKITGRIEVRNRFFWGDEVKINPRFKEQLRNPNEFINLSTTWWRGRSIIFHSNVERLWLDYRKGKWNLRAGRQRINWGLTNTWNPNDLFNTYNFLDFDYEERPGSDAAKIQYSVGELSNIEFAYAKTKARPVSAIKYFTNYKKYDLQIIAGIYQNRFTAGMGWAGSISDVGFKGEAEFYTNQKDSASHFTSSVEADYIFKNGWYVSSAVLYNQKGLHQPIPGEMNMLFEASPRNLMPARWSLLLNSSREFTPRFNGSMTAVYSPGLNMVILFPSFRYNLKLNLDLDFVWQSFFSEQNTFSALSHAAFVRLKWSFADSYK